MHTYEKLRKFLFYQAKQEKSYDKRMELLKSYNKLFTLLPKSGKHTVIIPPNKPQ